MDLSSDYVFPFLLRKIGVRGCLVRLSEVVKTIRGRHNYNQIILNEVLSEIIVNTVCISSLFKQEGLFSLQIKSDGAIQSAVCDVTHQGAIRAWLRTDGEETEKNIHNLKDYTKAFGKGYMVFTIEPDTNDFERTQGVVELKSGKIESSVEYFFSQSEQIETFIKTGISTHAHDPINAGALLIQRLPKEEYSSFEESSWEDCKALFQTVSESELLDSSISPEDLIYKLFWQDQPEGFDKKYYQFGCRCSEEKIINIIKTFSDDEVKDIKTGNKIEAKCEFCSKNYIIPLE